jgi:predicted nucleic acid-binding protein
MAINYNLRQLLRLRNKCLITDANVLIYIFWPSINTFQLSAQYEAVFFRLKKQGTKLVVTMGILTEVTNRVFKEQWKAWNQSRIQKGLPPISNYKQFRRSNTGIAMMKQINDIIKKKILKQVEVVEKHFNNTEAETLFVEDQLDLTDRIIAAIAKERKYIVFTHDGDFVNTDVDVLTANGKILHTKR